MINLTEEMKEIIKKQLAILATVDEFGNPNIGPKRSMRLYDEKSFMFNENTGGSTQKNIENNGKMAIAYIDRENLKGYRFVGTAKLYTEGKYFEDAVKWAEKNNMKVPKAAGVFTIEKVFTLHSGAQAGKEVK